MSWAKLCDAFWGHPKVLAAGNEATGCLARAISYCACQLTDGLVPTGALVIIHGSEMAPTIERLVACGLYDRQPDGSIWVHDFLEFNPSRKDILKRRKSDRVRKESGRTPRGIQAVSARTPGRDGTGSSSTFSVLGIDGRASRQLTSDQLLAFDAFWQAYPRKDDRGAAEREWAYLRPTSDQAEGIRAACVRQAGSHQWVKEGGKYIKSPARWLKDRSWENQGVVDTRPGLDDPPVEGE